MHMLDPDKLSELWGVPWEKVSVDMDEFLDDVFVFSLGNSRFYLDHNSPRTISFRLDHHSAKNDGVIFQNITRVVYGTHRKILAIESVIDDFFSEMIIKSDGKFSIEVSKPIDLHKASFCDVLLSELKRV